MKNSLYRKIVIGVLLLQAFANIVIFIFFLNYIGNPNSEFNRNIALMVKHQAEAFKPLDGPKGDTGPQGIQGERGEKGDKGEAGKDSVSTNTTIIKEVPIKGDQGIQGDKGDQGERGETAEFRCNPDTRRFEYKYPSDEDWTNMGARCNPAS